MHALVLMSLLAASEKPSLAVLYFDNNTKNDDLEVMRKGLADMMVTDLVAWDGVTVVERDKFEAVVSELKLQRTKYFDQATAVKIGKFLEAKYLLTGSMTISGDKLILDARLLDAAKSQVVVTARADGTKDDVFPIEQQLVERIAAGIDLKLSNESGRRRAKVPSLDALLAYSKAIDLTDQGKLEEAQKAFAALVSKTPTFLMARERKDQAVKALLEYQKRRRDLIGETALRISKQADDAIAKGQDRFDSLTSGTQATLLLYRVIKGQFLARVLKQFVSNHDSHTRVVVKKAQALDTLRAWHENQRRLLVESEVHEAGKIGTVDLVPPLDAAFLNDLKDAAFVVPRSVEHRSAHFTLISFLFLGRLEDGFNEKNERSMYNVAPTWADLSPADAKAGWAMLDAKIEKAVAAAQGASPAQRAAREHDAIVLLDLKASTLATLQRDDEAVEAHQRVLDLFPTADNNDRREREIKKLIGAEHDYQHSLRERLAKGLKTCDSMDLAVGTQTSDFWLEHQGVEGLEVFWNLVFKACPPSAKTRSALAQLAKDLALDAAKADDCERSKTFWKRALEHGHSTTDMLGYFKNHIPWCQFGDIISEVQWLRFDWNGRPTGLDFNHSSIRSYDGKQLALGARNERSSIDLTLYLEPQGPGWKCREATYRTRDGDQVNGSCTVVLTRTAAEKGDYDEGTFTARFSYEQDGRPFTDTLSDGEFRLRRQ